MLLSIKQYFRIALALRKLKLLEFVRFDSKIASFLLSLVYIGQYHVLRPFRGELNSLVVAGKLFRHTQLDWCRHYSVRILSRCVSKYGAKVVGSNFLSLVGIDDNEVIRLKQDIINNQRPFDGRLIILSPPEHSKKGVILVKFTENFKYLTAMFDLKKLSNDYILILEPSFIGYFDENILCLMGQAAPILIQASEKVDRQFIVGLGGSFVPVDLGANCWVDDRIFSPIDNIKKEYDIIMISIWADFKRHYHLFEALSKCKKKNKIKVALIGKPWPKSLDEIKNIAEFFNVNYCIEYFEDLSQEEINILLNKSKVYLLLSKKEGFNKSVIEAMYADSPAFLLRGFNYGQDYIYINSQTGGYITPSKLVGFIDNIDDMLQERDFHSCQWVSKNISVDMSISKIIKLLSKIEKDKNIRINKELQLKVNSPELNYIDQSYWEKYSNYYKGLDQYFK